MMIFPSLRGSILHESSSTETEGNQSSKIFITRMSTGAFHHDNALSWQLTCLFLGRGECFSSQPACIWRHSNLDTCSFCMTSIKFATVHRMSANRIFPTIIAYNIYNRLLPIQILVSSLHWSSLTSHDIVTINVQVLFLTRDFCFFYSSCWAW